MADSSLVFKAKIRKPIGSSFFKYEAWVEESYTVTGAPNAINRLSEKLVRLEVLEDTMTHLKKTLELIK